MYLTLFLQLRNTHLKVFGATKEITKVIDSLDDNTRVPFTMHLKGFKYKEIAEHLNIPIGTVKSRIYFAKQSLMKDFTGL